MKNIEALLLDLDGTLLDIEVSFFMDTMVESMIDHFQEFIPPDVFRDGLVSGIDEIMAEPRPAGETNEDAFYRVFQRITGLNTNVASETFTSYYHRVFPRFETFGSQIQGASDLVKMATRKGYRIALATNPIFPRASVIERMRWGNLSPERFDVITDMETTRSCKPQKEYFEDLSAILNVSPERCLMVGNDVEQDLAASKVGMKTYLVDGRIIKRGSEPMFPDWKGDLEELGRLLGLW
ncbi:HAD family hydrolase [bacterium]|nr:MAG: HAD family hydrolase [bacterium]